MFKKKFIKEKKRLRNSFKYAFDGFGSAFHSERNMVIHVLMMLLVIIFGIILKIDLLKWIICLILFGLVISAELINTSIEKVIDIVCPNYDPRAKVAKDTAAAAVLILAMVAAIVGLIIFIPKITEVIIKFM